MNSPLDAPPPLRPLPWAVVALAVIIVVALLAYLTVYRPATAHRSNTVRVQDLTLTLAATPDSSVKRGIRLVLHVSPELGAGDTVDMDLNMPTMSHGAAAVRAVRLPTPGDYEVIDALDMAGLGEVRATVHRSGETDATGVFTFNG